MRKLTRKEVKTLHSLVEKHPEQYEYDHEAGAMLKHEFGGFLPSMRYWHPCNPDNHGAVKNAFIKSCPKGALFVLLAGWKEDSVRVAEVTGDAISQSDAMRSWKGKYTFEKEVLATCRVILDVMKIRKKKGGE